MDFEKMIELLQLLAGTAKSTGGTAKNEPEKKPEKKKEEMTAAERLDALEKMYAKKDEDDALMKRIEALEKRAPKVNSDIANPVGIDDIITGLVPGLLKTDKEE